MSKNLRQRGAQGRHAAEKELQALVNENKASQVYDMTQLKVWSPERHMREGETLTGELTMVQDYEQFEFIAQAKERYTRNPIIWHGEYINVHRDKLGNYQACFRRMTIGKRCSPVRVTNAISTELLTAKKVLGL
jgi:hypothetical protein